VDLLIRDTYRFTKQLLRNSIVAPHLFQALAYFEVAVTEFWHMEHTVEFWLPFPPSTNRLWRSVRGRVVLSEHYKNWKHDACHNAGVLQQLGKNPVIGTHELELKLSTSFMGKGDADNRLKAVFDVAQELKLIVDDKLCRRAVVEWATIDHDCLVRLTGEIAYKDQWEFAKAVATKQYRQRSPSRRV
jgi:Holliday junction resolvase RusA-like endonuclease